MHQPLIIEYWVYLCISGKYNWLCQPVDYSYSQDGFDAADMTPKSRMIWYAWVPGVKVRGQRSWVRGQGSGVRAQGSGIRGQGLGAKCALTQGTYCTFDRKPWMASYLRVWRAELNIQYSIILPPTPLSLSTDSEKLKLFSTCQDSGL